jgi:hypothetical protein
LIPINDPEFFDRLILEGALEPAALDEDGEMLFNFTSKLPDISPEMHQRVVDNIYEDVRRLWAWGFIDMNMFEENPTIHLTSMASDKGSVAKLPQHYRFIIETIRSASSQEG